MRPNSLPGACEITCFISAGGPLLDSCALSSRGLWPGFTSGHGCSAPARRCTVCRAPHIICFHRRRWLCQTEYHGAGIAHAHLSPNANARVCRALGCERERERECKCSGHCSTLRACRVHVWLPATAGLLSCPHSVARFSLLQLGLCTRFTNIEVVCFGSKPVFDLIG